VCGEERIVTGWIGTAWGLGSAISWACANVSIQGASRRVGSWSALVWAQILGGLGALGLAWWVDGVPTFAAFSAAIPSAAIAGLSAALAYGGLFESLRRGQVAIVSPIISAWSVVSVTLVAIQGAPPAFGVGAGVALVVVGNVLVARATHPDGSDAARATPRSAIAWALGAACGFGVMVPALNSVGEHVGRLWAVPLVWLVELMVLVPGLLVLRKLVLPPTRRDVLALGQAALFEVGGFIALSMGLGVAAVSIVSPVSSLSTMGSVVLGVVLLKERVARSALVGALLASGGVVIINL
jgi:drug/metabolite transporter (DMT)-like permease